MTHSAIADAIAYSISHDTIATLVVADNAAAQAAITEAADIAFHSDREFDYTDSNEGWDLWAKEIDHETDMAWRVTVRVEPPTARLNAEHLGPDASEENARRMAKWLTDEGYPTEHTATQGGTQRALDHIPDDVWVRGLQEIAKQKP